ncbi:MAG: hypothetical protein ACLQUW_09225 [Desulfobaccales bacterium]
MKKGKKVKRENGEKVKALRFGEVYPFSPLPHLPQFLDSLRRSGEK